MKQFSRAVCSRCVSFRLLLTGAGLVLFLAVTVTGFSQTPTGNPSTDGGWTAGGTSSAVGTWDDGTASYSATIYSTAFTLAPASSLLSTLDGYDWNVGDTIVGVGGVFSGINNDLTYSGGLDEHGNAHAGATSTRIVIKYGSSSATWSAPASPPNTVTSSPGYGSMAHGGVGTVLLGTFPYDFYPSDAGQLIVPSDSPLLQTGPATTMTITGDVGRVITAWTVTPTTTNEVGFESFLDLTLLNSSYPSNGVQLGNLFDLDLQRGTAAAQDSLGTLPSAVTEPSAIALVAVGLLGAWSIRRRNA